MYSSTLIIIVVLSLCTHIAVAVSHFNAKNVMSRDDIIAAINHDVNLTWVDFGSPDGWHMPIISTGAAKMFGTYLVGNATPGSWNNFCIQEIWNYPIAIYPGFDETQVAKCKVDPKVQGFWMCTFWSDKSPARKCMAFPSYGDNKDYFVVVRVWQNQQKDWMVYSPHTTVTDKQKEAALHHIETLGFVKTEYITVDYSGCKLNKT